MGRRTKAKVKVTPKKGKGNAASKIREKVRLDPYVGDESERLRGENSALKRQLDSINVKMKIQINDFKKSK